MGEGVGVTVAGSGVAVTTTVTVSGAEEEQAKRRIIEAMAISLDIRKPLRVQVANRQICYLFLSEHLGA